MKDRVPVAAGAARHRFLSESLWRPDIALDRLSPDILYRQIAISVHVFKRPTTALFSRSGVFSGPDGAVGPMCV